MGAYCKQRANSGGEIMKAEQFTRDSSNVHHFDGTPRPQPQQEVQGSDDTAASWVLSVWSCLRDPTKTCTIPATVLSQFMSDPTVLLKTLGVPMVHVDGDQQTASLQGLPTALAHGLPRLPGLPVGPFSCSSTPGRVDAPIDPPRPSAPGWFLSQPWFKKKQIRRNKADITDNQKKTIIGQTGKPKFWCWLAGLPGPICCWVHNHFAQIPEQTEVSSIPDGSRHLPVDRATLWPWLVCSSELFSIKIKPVSPFYPTSLPGPHFLCNAD